MGSTLLESPARAAALLRDNPVNDLRRLEVVETETEVIVTGIVTSYYLKQMAAWPPRIEVIPNGIAAPALPLAGAEALSQRLGVEPGDRVIGTVGRLSEQKGLTHLIDAFADVAAPPSCTDSSEPIGARMTGMRRSRPRKLAFAVRFDTSRMTRGRKAMESRAIRLRRKVVSVSVPPTT